MQDRYAYYPGCLASLSQKELDTSTRAVASKLEVELVEHAVRARAAAPATSTRPSPTTTCT